MNFWKDKNEFWGNKTTDNSIYTRQRMEIAEDLIGTMSENGWKSILDVGGHKGKLREYIPTKYRSQYKCIDYQNNFELLKGWADQGLAKKYDVVLVSLTLLTIPTEKIPFIMDQMCIYAKHLIYIFDEDPKDKPHGYKINDDYGGKWVVTLPQLMQGHFNEFAQQSVSQSRVNPAWIKYQLLRKLEGTLL